jgi:sorting nexin-1/2
MPKNQVTDPQQIGEGRGAHTYYRIDVRRGQYDDDPIASVRRRYSDFQWLFQRLHAERSGSIVPIIPHTQAVQLSKRLSEQLIEERRVYLERFLRRVQVHPELEGAPSLAAFFSPDVDAFEAAKAANPGNADHHQSTSSEGGGGGGDDRDASLAATRTEKAIEKVKHLWVKTSVKAKVARGNMELEETTDGKRMEEVENYIDALDAHVRTMSRCTLYLAGLSGEISTNMHELGQSLFGLHQLYDPETSSTSAGSSADSDVVVPPGRLSALPSVKAISSVLASLSAINKVKCDENQSKVGAPMKEVEWMIKAARLAIKRRKACQLTYNTYLQQVRNRESTLEKTRAAAELIPGNGHADKIGDAQRLVETARKGANVALAELDVVTQRVFREMDRFKRVVDMELRSLYANLARVEVEHTQQLDGEWNKLLIIGGGGTYKSTTVSPPSTPSRAESEMMMI